MGNDELIALRRRATMREQLNKARALREELAQAANKANERWNSARMHYAKLHADYVREHGEELAPLWVDFLDGPPLPPNTHYPER